MRRLLLALGLWVCVAQAQAQAKTWRLGTIELPPSISQKAPDQGYYAVLLRRVLQELGDDAEFVFLPAQRAYQEAAQGRLDGVLPYRRTPERERELWFTDAFAMARERLFLRANDAWEPAAVLELRGRTGCALLGSQAPAPLQAEMDAGRVPLQRVSQIDACFRMLHLGRVDFVVTGQHTGWAALQRLRPEGLRLRTAALVLAEEPVHLGLSRRVPANAQRVEAFNQALRRLRSQGVMQQLEARHVPHHPLD